jgi:hypothetical protein
MNIEAVDAALTIGGMRKVSIGWGASVLVILFLMMDAVMKILALPVVLEAGASIGFPGPSMNRALGVLLLVCTLLYLAPPTSVIGAILITAYLGGAVATHLRLGNPLFTHVLFGVYVGVFLWAGLVLRQPQLLKLFPFVRP